MHPKKKLYFLGCAPHSADTSMKCSPHRPDSCCTSGSVGGGDAQMKSQSATETTTSEGGCTEEEEGDDDAFLPIGQCLSPTKTPRQPFQLLQERQYSTSTTDGSAASAQATPSAMGGTAESTTVCGSGKNGRQRFFGSGEQEGGLQALPELVETSPQPRRFSAPFAAEEKTPSSAGEQSGIQQQQQALSGIGLQSAVHVAAAAPCRPTRSRPVIASLSSGSSSGGSSGTSAQTVIGITRTACEQQQLGSGGARSGVVRRRSWRLHYSRPKNKSLEYETGNIHEVGGGGFQFLNNLYNYFSSWVEGKDGIRECQRLNRFIIIFCPTK